MIGVSSAPFCRHSCIHQQSVGLTITVISPSRPSASIRTLAPWLDTRVAMRTSSGNGLGVGGGGGGGMCMLGSSPCWRPWAGGKSTYRALGAAPAFSVPRFCHLGPKLPDCTSSLLIRSFPTSSPVSRLTFDLAQCLVKKRECLTTTIKRLTNTNYSVEKFRRLVTAQHCSIKQLLADYKSQRTVCI